MQFKIGVGRESKLVVVLIHEEVFRGKLGILICWILN